MPGRIQRFSANWSAVTWLVTLLVIIVAVIATGAVLKLASADSGSERVLQMLVALILPVILMVTVLFAPLAYTVESAGIVINRMGRNVYVPYDDVAEVQRISHGDVGFGVRLWASGGFFGFYGSFWSRRLGRFQAYATDTRHLVLIRHVDGRKLLLSPNPADVFVELVQNRLAQDTS